MELHVFHIVENDGRTSIGTVELDVDVTKRKTIDMASEESVGRTLTEELGNFGVFLLEFGIRLAMCLLHTATIAQLNVAEADVLDRMVRHTRDLDARERVAVVGNDIADADVAG